MRVLKSIAIISSAVLCFAAFSPTGSEVGGDSKPTEIPRLIGEVDSLISKRQLDSAATLAQHILDVVRKELGESDTTVANVLHLLGRCRAYQANYAESESLWNAALTIRQETLGADHLVVAQSLNSLANLYSYRGEFARAEPLCQRALEIREKALGPDHPDVAVTLNNFALMYWQQCEFDKAEPLHKRALDIREKTLGPDHPEVAISLNNLGLLYWDQGKLAEAEPLYKRALEIEELAFGSNHPDVAQSLNNLGLLYWLQGRFEEAEPLYIRAISIKENVLGEDHPGVAITLDNLANLYRDRGEFTRAEPLLRRALAITEDAFGPNYPGVASILDDLGNNLLDLGRYQEAESNHKRALAIVREVFGENHPDVAEIQNDLGNVYYCQGKYDEAEPLFRESLSIRESTLGIEHFDAATSMRNLALLYGSRHDESQSLANYDRLLDSRRRFATYAFGHCSEDQKMRYVEKYPSIEHSFISFALAHNSIDSREIALKMVLNGKAAVLDAVSDEREIAYSSYNDDIVEKIQRHSEICGKISTLTLVGAEKLDLDIYRDRLHSLYSEKDSLEEDLSRSCADFRDELSSKDVSVEDVAAALPDGAVLWEFIRYEPYDFDAVGIERERTGRARYAAFTLDHLGNTALTDLGDAIVIDSLVSAAREQIYSASSDVYSPMANESEERLRQVTEHLQRLIFAPLESHVDSETDIFVSPDGQLSLIPFEILPRPDSAYTIEEFRISYLSSGRDLLRKKHQSGHWALIIADPDFSLSRQESTVGGTAPLYGSEILQSADKRSRGISDCFSSRFDPLPYSREEARSVSKRLAEEAALDTELLYGADALEETLKAMTVAPRILHLATHGYFCEDVNLSRHRLLENPLLRSGLALAGANHLMDEVREETGGAEDGFLTAFETSSLNLIGTELVVLSACESGLGKVKNGEGVYGLRRAFQCAGAKTLVMSLWKVPDKETLELMHAFYEKWLSGYSKKEALRQSALEILNNCRTESGIAHPYYWGGFVLVGEPE